MEEELVAVCGEDVVEMAGLVVDELWEVLVEVAPGVTLKARYAPTPATTTTTTIATASAVTFRLCAGD